MLSILLSIAIAFLVLLCLDRLLRNDKFNKIPGPSGILLLKNTLDFIMDPVPLFYYFRKLSNTFKQVFKFQIGPKRFIAIINPEDVEILISGTKYNTKGYVYGFIEAWLKEGLLLSNGSKWHHRRKILTPAFHFNILRVFNNILEENSQKFAQKLEVEVGKPKTNIISYISDFTLHSICETAMGTKLDEESADFGRSYKKGIHQVGQYVVYRAQRLWMYPNMIFPWTQVGGKQKKILDLMRSFRDSVINQRRETSGNEKLFLEMLNRAEDDSDNALHSNGKKKLAMLDLLLQAEKDGTIDADGIGEEVDTFMFEGHDTTATALQLIFMLLANNKESQDRIVEEFNAVFGSSIRSPSISDLSQLKYTEACIKEGLRLYPPVHFIIRNLKEPMKLSREDHEVPAGTDCIILIYDLHRRSDQFSEPLEFRPERFLTEKPTWHPYSYIPFSAGPRNCIGQKFAMMEMKLAILAVLRKYRLYPVTKPEDVVFVTDFILRPNHPVYVKLERREDYCRL